MVILFVRLPLVAVTVSVAEPIVAVGLAVRVSVDPVVEDVGLKVAVTPEGKPPIEKVALLLKPPWSAMAIAVVADWFCLTETTLGLAESL
jgi:hypothetical protein